MIARVTLIVFHPAVSLESFSVPRCFWLTCEQPTYPPAACEVSAFLISREMKLQLVQICKHNGSEIISPAAIVVKLRVSRPLVPSFPSFSLSQLMNVRSTICRGTDKIDNQHGFFSSLSFCCDWFCFNFAPGGASFIQSKFVLDSSVLLILLASRYCL